MKSALVTMLALIITMGFTLNVMAVAPEKQQLISGTIQKVDIASNTLTLETAEGHELTYAVDAQTKITLKGMPSALADLKVGRNVTVEANGEKAVVIKA